MRASHSARPGRLTRGKGSGMGLVSVACPGPASDDMENKAIVTNNRSIAVCFPLPVLAGPGLETLTRSLCFSDSRISPNGSSGRFAQSARINPSGMTR